LEKAVLGKRKFESPDFFCFCVCHLYTNVYRLNFSIELPKGKTPLEKTNVVIASTVAVAITGLFAALLASGAVISSKTIASSGIIATANIGVYSDSTCTQSLTSINWGTISPGGSVSRAVYVKNLDTTQVTLGMTGENWSPASADGPLTLTWNQDGTTLDANQVATATLTLTALSSISGITTFNVDIVIICTG
jgi:hypothetical protein